MHAKMFLCAYFFVFNSVEVFEVFGDFQTDLQETDLRRFWTIVFLT